MLYYTNRIYVILYIYLFIYLFFGYFLSFIDLFIYFNQHAAAIKILFEENLAHIIKMLPRNVTSGLLI